MNNKLLALLMVGLTIGGGLIGYGLHGDKVQAQPVPQIVYVDREVIKEVEVPVREYVEKPYYINVYSRVYLREFPNLEILKTWVAKQNIGLDFNNGNSNYTCVDNALKYQRLAAEDGYYLSACLVDNGKVYGTLVMKEGEFHMGNLATIGDTAYYVDVPFNKIIKVCDLH